MQESHCRLEGELSQHETMVARLTGNCERANKDLSEIQEAFNAVKIENLGQDGRFRQIRDELKESQEARAQSKAREDRLTAQVAELVQDLHAAQENTMRMHEANAELQRRERKLTQECELMKEELVEAQMELLCQGP